jgi:hypothetical protein
VAAYLNGKYHIYKDVSALREQKAVMKLMEDRGM